MAVWLVIASCLLSTNTMHKRGLMVEDYSHPYSQSDHFAEDFVDNVDFRFWILSQHCCWTKSSRSCPSCDERPVVALLRAILHPFWFALCLIAVGWRLFGLCLSALTPEIKLQLKSTTKGIRLAVPGYILIASNTQ